MSARTILAVTATAASLGASLLASTPAQAGTTGPTVITTRSTYGTLTTVTQTGASPLHAVRSSAVSCTGTPVAVLRAKNVDNRVGGLVYVYWHPTYSGGTIVACVRHVNAYYDNRALTEIDIEGAKSATSRPMVSIASVGNYRQVGGPVAIGGLNLKGSVVRIHASVGTASVVSPVIIPSQAN